MATSEAWIHFLSRRRNISVLTVSAQNILDNSSEAVAQRRLERFDNRRRYDEPALEADLS
jgi:hypothetical protein